MIQDSTYVVANNLRSVEFILVSIDLLYKSKLAYYAKLKENNVLYMIDIMSLTIKRVKRFFFFNRSMYLHNHNTPKNLNIIRNLTSHTDNVVPFKLHNTCNMSLYSDIKTDDTKLVVLNANMICFTFVRLSRLLNNTYVGMASSQDSNNVFWSL